MLHFYYIKIFYKSVIILKCYYILNIRRVNNMNDNGTKTIQADNDVVKEISKIAIDMDITRKDLINKILHEYVEKYNSDKK